MDCQFAQFGCSVKIRDLDHLRLHLESDAALHVQFLLEELKLEKTETDANRRGLKMAQQRCAQLQMEMRELRQQISHFPSLLQLMQRKDRVIMEQGRELDKLRRLVSDLVPESQRPDLQPLPPPAEPPLPPYQRQLVQSNVAQYQAQPPVARDVMADAPAAAGAVLGPVRQGSAAFRLLHRFADALQNADQPEEEANAEDQMWNRVLQLQQEHESILREHGNPEISDQLLVLFPKSYVEQLKQYNDQQRRRSADVCQQLGPLWSALDLHLRQQRGDIKKLRRENQALSARIQELESHVFELDQRVQASRARPVSNSSMSLWHASHAWSGVLRSVNGGILAGDSAASVLNGVAASPLSVSSTQSRIKMPSIRSILVAAARGESLPSSPTAPSASPPVSPPMVATMPEPPALMIPPLSVPEEVDPVTAVAQRLLPSELPLKREVLTQKVRCADDLADLFDAISDNARTAAQATKERVLIEMGMTQEELAMVKDRLARMQQEKFEQEQRRGLLKIFCPVKVKEMVGSIFSFGGGKSASS